MLAKSINTAAVAKWCLANLNILDLSGFASLIISRMSATSIRSMSRCIFIEQKPEAFFAQIQAVMITATIDCKYFNTLRIS